MKKDLSYYQKLNYEMHIRYDADDKAWFVSFSDLPGCLADGATPPEALRNAERVKKEWIKSALEEGWEVPEPAPQIEASGRLTFRPPKSIHQRIIERAKTEGVSINQLVTAFVVQGLERVDAKEAIKKAADEQISRTVTSVDASEWYTVQPLRGNVWQDSSSQWQQYASTTQKKGAKEHEGNNEPFYN